jgi:hypothetical protein
MLYGSVSVREKLTSVSNTSDTSANNKLSGSAARRRNSCDLDNDTDNHDNSTEEDGLATTETVTKVEDEESTKEAADSVDGHDETFVGLVCNLGEIVQESGCGDDTGHDTLICNAKHMVSFLV